jgi:hypothetical protein
VAHLSANYEAWQQLETAVWCRTAAGHERRHSVCGPENAEEGIEMRQHAACKQVAAALPWYSYKMKQG